MKNQAAVANADPHLQGSIWLAGDGLPWNDEAPLPAIARHAAFEVDRTRLESAVRPPETERFAFRPPAPATTVAVVDERTAEAALRDVLAALRAADNACSRLRADGSDGEKTAAALQPTIRTLGRVTTSLMEFYGAAISMETLQLRLFEIQSNGIYDLMSLSFSNQRMLREVESSLARRQVEAENRARDEQAKMNEKAGKGGALALVCNWAMAAAQMVTGVVKLLTGQPQGVVDVGAAVAGFTKCILMTIVYCHPELKEELQDDIERSAKAELALGAISGAVSLFSAARAVQAGRFIVKAAVGLGKAEGRALGVTLSRAISTAEDAAQAAKNATVPAVAVAAMRESKSAMAAAEQIATSLGKEVAENSVARMQAALRGLFQARSPQLAERLAKMFGEEAIERMVSESLMKAAKTVARKGFGDAVSLVEQEFTKQVKRETMRALARAAISRDALIRSATTVVSVGTKIAVPIVDGAMTIQFAGKQREVNELLLDAIVFGFLIDNTRRAVKQEEEFRQNLMDDLQALTTNTSRGVREAAECMQQVVGNMA